MRVVNLVREGAYRFHGITDTTINHGEGWHFIQLGKYIERACNLCLFCWMRISRWRRMRTIWIGWGC